MINLIQAERFKLIRNKTFGVLILTITGFSALLHFLIVTGWWQVTGTAFDSAGLSELNALSNFTVPLLFNLIVSTLAGFYISTEFSIIGVIKNQILSGRKRSEIFLSKFLIFTCGSIIVTILIPLVTGIIVLILMGHGDILNLSNMLYLGRVILLFTLQLIGYTAIIMLLAITTQDSGKTLIFSILFTIVMFAIEKLNRSPLINMLYENSIFHQFSAVFNVNMTNGEILQSIAVAFLTIIIVVVCGIAVFNRKEIK